MDCYRGHTKETEMSQAFSWVVAHKAEIAIAALAISELLPLTDKVKANGLFQLAYNAVKKLAGK